jgi:hypothetical protein
MSSKNVRAQAPKSDVVMKRKRFHIERLEERIAPTGGKGTHNCPTLYSGLPSQHCHGY